MPTSVKSSLQWRAIKNIESVYLTKNAFSAIKAREKNRQKVADGAHSECQQPYAYCLCCFKGHGFVQSNHCTWKKEKSTLRCGPTSLSKMYYLREEFIMR